MTLSTISQAEAWINSNSFTFTVWGWGAGPTWWDYQEYSESPGFMPFTVIIDADRNVRYQKTGSVSLPSTFNIVIDELV